MEEKRDRFKDKKKIDDQIAGMEYARTLIPRYEEKVIPSFKPYRSYLVDTGYKTEIENLRNKYLVFDVETNGLRQSNDDLLSLSIYDPTTGLCYNRFFPLDLQPLILTGFINGIDDATLADATHMTQHEFDWLKDFFHFEDRILLSFSGGKGNFDPNFLKNYLQRQKVNGFEDLKFENIKNRIPPAPFGLRGELTKDNLCKLFGIDGVNEIHSSFNDCLLEWKLFEKLESKCHFFNGDSLYEYTPEYIIPYSILVGAPALAKFAGITIPEIDVKATEIFKFDFPKNLLRKIKKFPTNITGICIEHGINCYLHAERQDNLMFLAQNKARLKCIGSLASNVETIPILLQDNGTIKSVKEEHQEFVDETNSVTNLIIENIKPVADFLLNNIFKDGKIMTQELSISEDRKVLALCDLSDSKNVMEIKTCRVLDANNCIGENIARQLYFQARGRNTYLLSMIFETHHAQRTYNLIVDDLKIFVYKIDLVPHDSKPIVHEKILNKSELAILKIIIENPKTTKTYLGKKIGLGAKWVDITLVVLTKFGYIKKENPTATKSSWIVLRKPDDIKTKFILDGGNIKILNCKSK